MRRNEITEDRVEQVAGWVRRADKTNPGSSDSPAPSQGSCYLNLPLIQWILVSWGGVRLSPLGTSATNWPIVSPRMIYDECGSTRWNENWQGEPKYSEKTGPSATLSTINPI
jgi:hypothetical protein